MAKHKHHGGAWKVAYADFVTAMMALFLVLWLTAQDEKIKEAVERAFRNPFSSVTQNSTGLIANREMHAVKNNEGNFDSASAVELSMLRKLNEDLMRNLQEIMDDEEESTVRLELTSEGVRISVFDRSRKPIFEEQTPVFTAYGDWVFSTLAWAISRYSSFDVELEGHTEAGYPEVREDYGQWELSCDRAVAARRKLIEHAVEDEQVIKVSGYGSTQPMQGLTPESESNRRVTVMLKLKKGAKGINPSS